MENPLLKEVKNNINNYLNSAKVNMKYPTRDNLSQPINVKQVLYEIMISKDNYYIALLISKKVHLQLHLKRQPNSSFF